jgi:hypothetical protein
MFSIASWRCQILVYRLAGIIPFLEISHVSETQDKDVLEHSRDLWDDIKHPRDSKDTILLHPDPIPRTSCNIYYLCFVAMKISKILIQVDGTMFKILCCFPVTMKFHEAIGVPSNIIDHRT